MRSDGSRSERATCECWALHRSPACEPFTPLIIDWSGFVPWKAACFSCCLFPASLYRWSSSGRTIIPPSFAFQKQADWFCQYGIKLTTVPLSLSAHTFLSTLPPISSYKHPNQLVEQRNQRHFIFSSFLDNTACLIRYWSRQASPLRDCESGTKVLHLCPLLLKDPITCVSTCLNFVHCRWSC